MQINDSNSHQSNDSNSHQSTTANEVRESDERLLKLMQGIANRDAASFDELCSTVRGILLATIYKVLNNREDSEDVCQDVLAKVWERGNLFDSSKGRPLTWLRTLARNRAIDRIRSKQRRAELHDRFRGEVDEPSSRTSRDLTDEVSTREHASLVRDAVIQLNPDQKQVLELAYFGGMTQTEIATRLNQPLGTVKARVRRGVKCLREMVAPTILTS